MTVTGDLVSLALCTFWFPDAVWVKPSVTPFDRASATNASNAVLNSPSAAARSSTTSASSCNRLGLSGASSTRANATPPGSSPPPTRSFNHPTKRCNTAAPPSTASSVARAIALATSKATTIPNVDDTGSTTSTASCSTSTLTVSDPKTAT